VSDEVLGLHDVGVRFGSHWALRHVTLSIAVGERVALVGPSGAGKTTLLSLFNGTVAPTEGRVSVLGEALPSSGRRGRGRRTRIGTIRQGFDLIGSLQVVHNVNAGRLGRWSVARAATSLLRPRDIDDVRAALARTGIEHKLYARTDELSGGELQRVALARVLVQDPEVVLADEPISNLDPARAREIMDLLHTLALRRRALLVALHDIDFARSHFDRLVGLRQGQIVFDGAPNVVDATDFDALYRT
jgi:phosphonate transport system ATP-binding protein